MFTSSAATIKTLILFAFTVWGTLSEYKPLQLVKPVSMYIQYGDLNLEYAVARQATANVLFCFVSTRQVNGTQIQEADGSFSSQLTLQDTSKKFFCIRLYKDANDQFAHQSFEKVIDITQIWTADKLATLTKATTNTDQYYQPLTGNETVKLQSQLLTQILVISNYFKMKSIYHMVTCPEYNKATGECAERWKFNYMHTFQHPEKKMNTIVQRIHNGGTYRKDGQNITTHIFYGGALRNNEYYLFTAILTYHHDESQMLNMWGGFACSCDHANRDMFCYDTDGNAFDAISLIAGPVYKDIAPNIGGVDDAELVDNFYSERYNNYYMYFIQYHRPYTTDNDIGDEKIMKKIYGKFCYAADFQLVQPGQDIIIPPSCLSSSYKHNFLLAFSSDVEVFQPLFSLLIAFLILAFI